MSGMKFLVMAGGTGGHVYPALSFAKKALASGHQVAWLGTATGLEADLVPRNGIEFHAVPFGGVRGKGIAAKLRAG